MNNEEKFLLDIKHTPFLQSSGWGAFQRKVGNESYHFSILEGKNFLGVATAYKIKAKFNSFLYVPWGPVVNKWEKEPIENFLEKLKDIAQKDNLDFIRLEPRVIEDSGIKILSQFGFKQVKSFTQPECTSIIDLSKEEEELLSSMSGSTRYNVRNVERKGVIVRKGEGSDVTVFEKLLKETANRHKFSTDIHSDYYKIQYEVLRNKDMIDIFVAELENKPLATSLVIFYGDTATYLHAASSGFNPKLRASYLLVWKSILEAKARGYKYFDFWGVAPKDVSSTHPWRGVTNFKMSFGGERVCYAPIFDLPTSSKYLLSKFIDITRNPVKKIFGIYSG